MIAKDYEEIYSAVSMMETQLKHWDVKYPTTFGNLTSPAKAFAETVLLECSKDQVEVLTRQQPEQAAAFLSMLNLIQKELSSVFGSPDVEKLEPSRMNMIAAAAVLNMVDAYRARRSFLSYMER
jgi:hypothetical protein